MGAHENLDNAGPDPVRVWNKVAGQYEQKFMQLDLYNDTYDAFCKRIPGGEILEIACGPGNISRYLLTAKPNLQLLGIDSAAEMIALARLNNPTATFELMDAREIAHLNRKFDGIVCGFGIPFLSPEECCIFIADCANLLNNHGILYLSFMPGDPSLSGYKTSSSGDQIFFHYHPKEFIMQLFAENGFAKTEQFSVSYPDKNKGFEEHFIIIAEKQFS